MSNEDIIKKIAMILSPTTYFVHEAMMNKRRAKAKAAKAKAKKKK
tara:strand:+ start:748 stop:882 length:135 start_codon:yes stop_codon:yes gene_type:complete